jgi:hypothetical protein
MTGRSGGAANEAKKAAKMEIQESWKAWWCNARQDQTFRILDLVGGGGGG